ncbi:hypothetical protein [Saccharothrix sp. NRRL B-16314]|uniref:hypothetical protein n=1 Tax=Saccharothrix sp. NRRL B-16314 TaxID=1463825 RepID=UPI0012DDE1CD|nr:hypothetical protein [Saccharothrix sp. NRRL B-16314]
MRNVVMGALVVLCAVSGCSTASTDEVPAAAVAETVATTAATTVGTTASAVPVPLAKDEAARRYLDIVKPYNEALEHLEQGLNDGRPIAEVQALADATAKANQAHVAELRAVVWPADVVPAMTALIAESEPAQPHWDRAALAPTREAVIEAVKAAIPGGSSEAATTIRTLLSLDKYDERDYP